MAPEWTARNILGTLNAHSQDLYRLGVRKIGLFGSYRRGTPTLESDMDFLVTLARASFDDYMAIKFFLEDLFGHPVDLVLETDLKPRLRDSILGEALYVAGL